MLTAKFVYRDGDHGTVLLPMSAEPVRVDFAVGASTCLKRGDNICVGAPGERGDLISANLQKCLSPHLVFDSG